MSGDPQVGGGGPSGADGGRVRVRCTDCGHYHTQLTYDNGDSRFAFDCECGCLTDEWVPVWDDDHTLTLAPPAAPVAEAALVIDHDNWVNNTGRLFKPWDGTSGTAYSPEGTVIDDDDYPAPETCRHNLSAASCRGTIGWWNDGIPARRHINGYRRLGLYPEVGIGRALQRPVGTFWRLWNPADYRGLLLVALARVTRFIHSPGSSRAEDICGEP